MKLPLLSSSLAILLAVQANAAPLRVLLLEGPIPTSPSNNASPTFRFGHTVPSAAPIAIMPFPNGKLAQSSSSSSGAGHQHCRMRQKAIAFSNLFREAIGLPPIPTDAATPNHHKGLTTTGGGSGSWSVLPFLGTPGPTLVKIDPETHNIVATAGGDDVKVIVRPGPGPHHHHNHFHAGGAMSSSSRPNAMTRLHIALMALGPWEGRAVAFVLGCGIGVLLRMLWVLLLVSYRSIRGDREDEQRRVNHEVEYTHILLEAEPAEVIFVQPPTYTDEKVAIKEDAN